MHCDTLTVAYDVSFITDIMCILHCLIFTLWGINHNCLEAGAYCCTLTVAYVLTITDIMCILHCLILLHGEQIITVLKLVRCYTLTVAYVLFITNIMGILHCLIRRINHNCLEAGALQYFNSCICIIYNWHYVHTALLHITPWGINHNCLEAGALLYFNICTCIIYNWHYEHTALPHPMDNKS